MSGIIKARFIHTQWNIDGIQKHQEKSESQVWLQWDVVVENTVFAIRGMGGKILISLRLTV